MQKLTRAALSTSGSSWQDFCCRCSFLVQTLQVSLSELMIWEAYLCTQLPGRDQESPRLPAARCERDLHVPTPASLWPEG